MRGRWQLQVAGSPGLTYVNVGGTADLAFSSFKLATFAGQPPHQGLFALDGEPGPGQKLYALASLTPGAADAAFTLRRKDYTTIMIELDGAALTRCVQGEFVYETDIAEADTPFARSLAA